MLDRPMPERREVPLSLLEPSPDNARTVYPEGPLLALGENMRTLGQKVDVIAYAVGGGKAMLLDGHRRYRAALLAKIPSLWALVYPTKPSTGELALTQLSIDVHREDLNPMDRSRSLAAAQAELGLTVSDLAAKVNVSQGMATKLLSLQRLAPPIQKMVAAGEIDIERAYIISQGPDHARQLELAKGAEKLSREQLRQKAKGGGQGPRAKTSLAKFPLVAGLCVTVQGREVTLAAAIDALSEAVKELKKGQSQGLDIATQQRVMRDKAKVKP